MRQADGEALVLALDEGSTGVRAMLLDRTGTPRGIAYRETLPDHPGPGLVEHDAEGLFAATAAVIREVLAGVEPTRVHGLGIATQRGSAVVWDAATGRAVHPILSWQDGRTVARCQALMAEGFFVSPLLASTKIEWLLDRFDPDREATRAGRLRCGTIDAWLAWRLSAGGASATDASNASCSGLYDLFAHRWQETMLDALNIPVASLPRIVDSSAVVGTLALDGLPRIPIAALIGDQQAAMMGQLRLAPGVA
jgi:glycerol kinase